MSTRNVTDNLTAHLAIQNLMNRYTNAVNQRNWSESAGRFRYRRRLGLRRSANGRPGIPLQRSGGLCEWDRGLARPLRVLRAE